MRGLIGDRAGNGLANPPGGISGELVALFMVKLLRRPDQTQAALLNQILEGQTPVHVLLGYRHHQTQV